MRDLDDLVPDGVARRGDLARVSSARSVSRWTASGALVRPHRGVVLRAAAADGWDARARAAVLWSDGVLSHSSALAVWRAVPGRPRPLHVTVPARRNPRRGAEVVVHRTTRPTPARLVGGHRVTALDRALVDAWAMSWAVGTPRAAVTVVRQAVIECVRTRRVPVGALRAESAAQRTHRGRRQLTDLLHLLATGCQSELEIWGVTHVLPLPGLPAPVQQRRVVLPGGAVFLDAAYEAAMVAVELDGAAFHGSREQRERDIRRDTALAALGWIVLRSAMPASPATRRAAAPRSPGSWRTGCSHGERPGAGTTSDLAPQGSTRTRRGRGGGGGAGRGCGTVAG